MLSSAEETKIKEAGRLQDQVIMLVTIVTGKDTQGSDALQGFIESSDSQLAQLIINHGKELKKKKNCPQQVVKTIQQYRMVVWSLNPNLSQFPFPQIPW